MAMRLRVAMVTPPCPRSVPRPECSSPAGRHGRCPTRLSAGAACPQDRGGRRRSGGFRPRARPPIMPRYADPRVPTSPGADPDYAPSNFPRPPPAEEPIGYRDLRTIMTGSPDLVFTPPLSRCRFEVSEIGGQCEGRWAVRIWVNPEMIATDIPHTSEISGTAHISCLDGKPTIIPLKDRGPAVLTNVMAFFAAAFHSGPNQGTPRGVTNRLHWSCTAPSGSP